LEQGLGADFFREGVEVAHVHISLMFGFSS
jgi:hypothetical protein